MPTYDYRCAKCRKLFLRVLSVKQHDIKRITCPKCASRSVKQEIKPFYAITSRKA